MLSCLTLALALVSAAWRPSRVDPSYGTRSAAVVLPRARAPCAVLEGLPEDILSLVGAGTLALGGARALAARFDEPLGTPYEADAKAYDPDAADRFYAKRLDRVAARLLRLGALTFTLNAKLLLDLRAYKAAGSPEDEPWPNEAERAKEVLSIATQLGPTFIKLAQALSIRTDLIPEAYALEVARPRTPCARHALDDIKPRHNAACLPRGTRSQPPCGLPLLPPAAAAAWHLARPIVALC